MTNYVNNFLEKNPELPQPIKALLLLSDAELWDQLPSIATEDLNAITNIYNRIPIEQSASDFWKKSLAEEFPEQAIKYERMERDRRSPRSSRSPTFRAKRSRSSSSPQTPSSSDSPGSPSHSPSHSPVSRVELANYRLHYLRAFNRHYKNLTAAQIELFRMAKLGLKIPKNISTESLVEAIFTLQDEDELSPIDWLLRCQQQDLLDELYLNVAELYKDATGQPSFVVQKTIFSALNPVTLMFWICTFNQAKQLEQAITHNLVDINKPEPNSDVYLIITACELGLMELCEVLISHGVNLAIENDDKVTPLLMAVYSGNNDLAQRLLQARDHKDNPLIPVDADLLHDVLFPLEPENESKKRFQFALYLLENFTSADFDFYKPAQPERFGQQTIFTFIRINSEPLFNAMLVHPSLQKQTRHDPASLFDCMLDDLCLNDQVSSGLISLVNQSIASQQPIVLPTHLEQVTEALDSNWLNNFPTQEAWRLCCDGVLQRSELGWTDYEAREPGYFQACAYAINFIQNTIEAELDVGLLKQIHYVCCFDVQNLEAENIPGEFRHNQSIRYAVNRVCAEFPEGEGSLAGLVELSEFINHDDFNLRVIRDDGAYRIFHPAEPEANIEATVQKILNDYQRESKQAQTPLERLYAIAKLAQYLTGAKHPFGDGNVRSICVFVVMRELIRAKFPPAIMDNPNVFDACSLQECVNELIQGMISFLAVSIGNTTHFGRSTEAILNQLEQSGDRHDLDVYENFCYILESGELLPSDENRISLTG